MPTRAEREYRTSNEPEIAADAHARYVVVVVDILIPGSPRSYVDPTIESFDEMPSISRDDGFTYDCCAAAVNEQIDVTDVIASIARGRKHWLAHPETYQLVDTADDIRSAKANSKLAVSFNFQGSNPI
jgi:hypothetical protein